MEQNIEFLNKIYRNAMMGEETIDTMINCTQDEAFKKVLVSKKQGYVDLAQKTKVKIEQLNGQSNDRNQIVGEGSMMGVIDA